MQSSSAAHDESGTRSSDAAAHAAGDRELPADAGVHDIQCLAVSGGCHWSWARILPVCLASCCCG